MKRIKVLAGLLLVVVMLLNVLPVGAAGSAAFEVQTVSAQPGEMVNVTVSIKNSPGITSAKMAVSFDEGLTLTDVAYGDVAGIKPQKMMSPVILNWADGLEDHSGNLLFATMTFRVAADAKSGLHPITLTYDPDDVFDVTETNIEFAIVNGGVQLGCAHTNKTEIPAKAATCAEAGNNKYYICASCNGVFKADGTTVTTVDAEQIPAKGHDFADATCTAPKTCKVCGTTEGEALGHSYADTWNKGEDGHWHECDLCGEKKDQAAHDFADGDKCVICQYERAHAHKLTLVPGKAATCTEAGSKAYYTCSDCENWFEDAAGTVVIADKTAIVIPTLDHTDADKNGKCDLCEAEVAVKPDPETPETGDNSQMRLWIGLGVLSLCGMAVCVITGKKRRTV